MILTLAEARLRSVPLPDDDDAAQAAIDEVFGWLASRIGPLDGPRTETFYVGWSRTCGPLYLKRYTDEVTVVDGSATLAADQVRLGANGSSIRRESSFYPLNWTGPYVTATYTPNDEDAVRKVVYDLLALGSESGPYESETMGAYSYNRGDTSRFIQSRAALVGSILPRRAGNVSQDTRVPAVLES